ncbi:alkaline serine protease [Bacterioplanes sanyensis]|uniref:Alkaline serine protease n=1 Tax=Bacterioplanes sanyensis TaxID=1249553 RepID=A0A222FEL3_9GAMM|nr:S8 family peptidase [Bacterioplanes sanyensis]ASP37448.1 alkaline serine protease [Bacterioplanes sanyensis]
MKTFSKAMTAAAILAASIGAHAKPENFITASSSNAIENSYIVIYENNTMSLSSAEDFVTQQSNLLQTQFGVRVQTQWHGAVNGVLVEASAQQAEAIAQQAGVALVEQNQRVQIDPQEAVQNNATWGLDRIDQRDLPLDSTYNYDFDGSGVTAYVIDTGVRNSHVEFGTRSRNGYDFVDNDNNSDDCNGHGTHVAGTIGGSTYGVAKNVDIVGVRVLSCSGSGTTAGVINGVNWVANDASGPAVANMSLGGGVSQALDSAVEAAVQSGVSFIVAAGNSNADACNSSPARATNAVTVGSTTSSDSRSSFSNYGTCLDIFAPGSSITSAWHTGDNVTRTISGTSMAAPHVAGVAALLLSEDASLTPAQVTASLVARSSANKVSDPRSGSPNRLLYSLEGDGGPIDPPVTELQNGKPVQASGAQGSQLFYKLAVPANAEQLVVELSGAQGSGDADLYVLRGSKPQLDTYDCRPYIGGNNERCSFDNPEAGDWYVMLRGYSSFSDVQLTATYSAGQCSDDNCLSNGVPVTDLSANRGDELYYQILVPANSTLTVDISGSNGDADLYVRKNTKPTLNDYDCRPYQSGSTERCQVTTSMDTLVHIMVRGYTRFSGVTLQANFTSN